MGDKNELVFDPHLVRLIEMEEQRKNFNLLVHKFTSQCWDLCMGTPGHRLDKKTEGCITSCVDRMIDTSNFVVHRLEKEGDAISRRTPKPLSEDLSEPTQDFKWQ